MTENGGNKWDLKQVATGGGGVVALLFMFQSQGVDLMSKSQQASNNVVIEKTIANARELQNQKEVIREINRRLESFISTSNRKIDEGFDSLRLQLRDETSKLSEIMRLSSADRWTRSEHHTYDQVIQTRLDRLDEKINELQQREKEK